MHVGIITIEIHIPGCQSLKQKRSRLKPLIAALHKNFNISAAEIAQQDRHQHAIIACAIVNSNSVQVQRVLGKIPDWIEHHRPDLQVVDDELELL